MFEGTRGTTAPAVVVVVFGPLSDEDIRAKT